MDISGLSLTRAVTNNAHNSYLLHKILPSADMHPVVQNGLEHFPNSLLHQCDSVRLRTQHLSFTSVWMSADSVVWGITVVTSLGNNFTSSSGLLCCSKERPVKFVAS